MGQCALDQLGLGELGSAAAAASGANVLPTRGKFGGATPNTSVASRGSRAVFGNAQLPVQVPTVTGFPGIGSGVSIRASARIATVVGRSIPVVGWALLAYDGISIAVCALSDD